MSGPGPQPLGRPGAPPEALQNRDWIARLLRVTPGTIVRKVRDGMPVARGGGQGRQAWFVPSEVVAWWLAQVEAKHAGQEAGLNPQLERAKRDRAQARLAEQLHRRRAGEVLEAQEVERQWGQILAAVRARLLAVPRALATRCATETDPAAVERLLRDEVHSALRDLATWQLPEDRPPGAPRESLTTRTERRT